MKTTIRKPILAIVILLVLLGLMTFVLIFGYLTTWQVKSLQMDSLKLDGIVNTMEMLNNNLITNIETQIIRTRMVVDVMRTAIQTLGPEKMFESLSDIIEDGVILRIKGSEIIYPKNFSGRFPELTAEELRNGMDIQSHSLVREGQEPETYLLTSGKITDELWYVDLTTEKDINDSIYLMEKYNGFLESTIQSYNGYLFMVSEEDPEMNFLFKPDSLGEDINCFPDLGIDQQDIADRKEILYYQNLPYQTRYINTTFFGGNVLAILMLDSGDEMNYSLNSILLISVLVFVIMTAIIFWLYFIQQYVQTHELTEEQKRKWHPQRVRKTCASLGLISVLTVFVAIFSWQTIANLYNEALSNQRSLQVLMNSLENSMDQNSSYQKDEEEWAVYYGERIALLLEKYPELKTGKFLAEISKTIDADYIMLFDETGKEELSSNEFINFALGTDEDDPTTDFRRLLMGVASIVHEPVIEKTSGHYVQMIGTRFPLENENYGALIVAMNPQQTWEAAEQNEISDFIQMITPSGNSAIIINRENQIIRYASDPGLIGKTAVDTGLDTSERIDSVLDSFVVNGKRYYGSFNSDGLYRYMYLTEDTYIQFNTIPFTVIVTICFAIIFAVICLFMLTSYKSDEYEKMVTVSHSIQNDSFENDQENGTLKSSLRSDVNSLGLKGQWREMEPEKKVTACLQLLLLFILIAAVFELSNSSSVLSFILRGNWKHGFNIMAYSGIVILAAIYIMFILINKALTRLLENVLDPKGLTIWKLSMSLLQYAAIIALLYFSFSYLGFNTTVLLTSVSILSLAISLGSKDLVADILAGVFLVFENDFNVGDIIDVNGFRGRVLEIGVRSTRLIGVGDNIKTIGNQNVKNILNMSRMNSWYTMELKIPISEPLTEIENMLRQELPKIGESIPDVISGPHYKGVWSISNGCNTLSVITECREEKLRRVQREVNRAIRILFEENGYKLN